MTTSAPIALRLLRVPTSVKGDPVVRRVGRAAIEDGRLILVRDDHVDGAAVREVRERDGAAVVQVGGADVRCDVDPTGDAAIQVHARSLVAGQARAPERGPRLRVLEEPRRWRRRSSTSRTSSSCCGRPR